MLEILLKNLKEAIEADKQKESLGLTPAEKVKEMLKSGNAIFVDVRPPNKVVGKTAPEAGIPNSYYLPVTEFADRCQEVFPQDKNAVIILGCAKIKFANRVMGYLEAFGYKNVYVLDEEIEKFIENFQ
ncbi:MAG: rhodanese-like domain-containing protein [Sulfurihydrogenibium sp.]